MEAGSLSGSALLPVGNNLKDIYRRWLFPQWMCDKSSTMKIGIFPGSPDFRHYGEN
jgi:hypothetical protein